ncbi:hypothetical protein [Aquella oligotrophica]|uniref:DUF1640 domain-containing protein n=1 Tax=Aquella oligotrophica TaxID=2067065 RepID=A0A2I7N632_9NEIS|nr:hypothetical protein [Aquella oligotrophica]AUR51924.1 hypothetical protein CUN60_06310 [Aquella oligotrophica]
MSKTLSIVDYIHELKEAGFTDKQAEVQAKRLEQIIAEVKADIKQDLETKELADKGDDMLLVKRDISEAELRLTAKIEQYRYDSLKFTVWTGITVVITIGGMLAKGFHWL